MWERKGDLKENYVTSSKYDVQAFCVSHGLPGHIPYSLPGHTPCILACVCEGKWSFWRRGLDLAWTTTAGNTHSWPPVSPWNTQFHDGSLTIPSISLITPELITGCCSGQPPLLSPLFVTTVCDDCWQCIVSTTMWSVTVADHGCAVLSQQLGHLYPSSKEQATVFWVFLWSIFQHIQFWTGYKVSEDLMRGRRRYLDMILFFKL